MTSLNVVVLMSVLVLNDDPAARIPQVLSAKPATDWNSKFAGTDGWIGADAVYSIPIGKNRLLWFFGDTFIGTVKNGRRDGASMVNNTIAVSAGNDVKSEMQFFYQKLNLQKSEAVFVPKDKKGYYWPLGGCMAGEKLVLFLSRIEPTKDGGAFGFRCVGQEMAVVSNPQVNPLDWNVEYIKIPHSISEPKHERQWGNAVRTIGNETFIYGIEERGKKLGTRQLLVSKVPTAKITDPEAWQFRTSNGWSRHVNDAAGMAAGLATEFSVGPFRDGGYILVYTENGIGDRIMGRFSKQPDGPWSDALLLYSCPEKSNKKIFCYSAKAHHDVAENDLLISYCVNGWELKTTIENESYYRPQFVRVQFGR